MGVVFRGKLISTETGKSEDVAIKVLFKGLSDDSVLRAQREASIQIVHENIIRMYGFVETTDADGNSKYHIISEFLDGKPLSDVLREKGCFSHVEAMNITKNVLAALYFLHNKGYVHRDIDPSNIMMCRDGRIKIIDFGIAKQLVEYHDEFRQGTIDGRMIGKVNYASPEQLKGEHWLTNQTSDIYSAGILLYELLTGTLPYTGTTVTVINGHLKQPIPKDQIPEGDRVPAKWIQYIIEKATSKLQKDRYQSASEFIVDIDRALLGKSPVPANWKKTIMIVTATVVLLLACAGGWQYVSGRGHRYANIIAQADNKMALGMYHDALNLYRDAYKITKTSKTSAIIGTLELLDAATGAYARSEYTQADSIFRIAADRDSPEALYYLGEMNYEGIGTPKNFKKGFEYTTRSANLENKLAEYRLGLIYRDGLDVARDDDKAVRYFENAGRIIDKGAEAGNPEFQFLKGDMYLHGNGVPMNRQRAIEYYEAAAAQNHPQAQYQLYELLEKQDNEKAMNRLRQSAGQGYPKAAFKLGDILIGGKDPEGLVWIQKAARQNYSPAFRKLGAIYQNAHNPDIKALQQIYGIEANDSISHFYTQKAVDFDFDNYWAMFDLALDYEKGTGTPRDPAMAKKYYDMCKRILDSLPFKIVDGQRDYGNKHPKAASIYQKLLERK